MFKETITVSEDVIPSSNNPTTIANIKNDELLGVSSSGRQIKLRMVNACRELQRMLHQTLPSERCLCYVVDSIMLKNNTVVEVAEDQTLRLDETMKTDFFSFLYARKRNGYHEETEVIVPVIVDTDMSINAVGWPIEWSQFLSLRIISSNFLLLLICVDFNPPTDILTYMEYPIPVPKRCTRNPMNVTVKISACVDKGPRMFLEDRYTVYSNLIDSMIEEGVEKRWTTKAKQTWQLPVTFMGVFDGHSGSYAAEFLARNFHTILLGTQDFCNGDLKKGLHNSCLLCEEKLKGELFSRRMDRIISEDLTRSTSDFKSIGIGGFGHESFRSSLGSEGDSNNQPFPFIDSDLGGYDKGDSLIVDRRIGFHGTSSIDTDNAGADSNSGRIMERSKSLSPILLTCGSTACVALISGATVYVANVGDCRCVISRNGRPINLSKDHKANDLDEVSRIKGIDQSAFFRGGYLMGQLAVSRSFGDFSKNTGKKLVGLSVVPDIRTHTLTLEDEFILIGSDGLFDVFTSSEAVNFVRKSLMENKDVELATNRLVAAALKHTNANDNITAVVGAFVLPDGLLKESNKRSKGRFFSSMIL
eukprot:GHVO01017441.1.p1 GENE.GHVO01017441.1~~GHVO01017441.1.p1  ORF type:complete len:588 (+),score=85.75 GHVO01017441.1:19-1782(+)